MTSRNHATPGGPGLNDTACAEFRDPSSAARFRWGKFPAILYVLSTRKPGTLKRLQRKRLHVADTTKVESKEERKKLKRTARKKAAPKAKRTGARGEKKKKVKKLARGQSKR